MKDKLGSLLIVVLFFVAGFLGYLIITKISGTTPPSASPQNLTGSTDTQSTPPIQYADQALKFPADTATQQQKDDHAAIVNRLAQDTDTLDLTNCKPSPVVIHVRPSGSFKVKNTGDASVTITIANIPTEIASKSEKLIDLSAVIGDSVGHSGYACANSGGASPQGTVGIISTAGFN